VDVPNVRLYKSTKTGMTACFVDKDGPMVEGSIIIRKMSSMYF
jgi:hypothetical protein